MVFHSTYVMLCVYNVCVYVCMYECYVFLCRLHWNVCTVPPPAPGLAGARLSAAPDHLGGAEDSACGIHVAHIHTVYTVHICYGREFVCIYKCYECIRLTRLCNGSCMYVLYVCFFYFVRLCWQSLCCGGWATSSLNTRRWIPRSSIHPMRYVCM